MPMVQKFNKKMGAFVKMKKKKSGMMEIVDVKQKKPKMPFKGVKKLK